MGLTEYLVTVYASLFVASLAIWFSVKNGMAMYNQPLNRTLIGFGKAFLFVPVAVAIVWYTIRSMFFLTFLGLAYLAQEYVKHAIVMGLIVVAVIVHSAYYTRAPTTSKLGIAMVSAGYILLTAVLTYGFLTIPDNGL